MPELGLDQVPRLSQATGLGLAARRVVEGLYGGRHRSPSLGAATEFHDHRPYQPGDDLRQIDWKAYGRSDHLLIRRYQEERDLPVTLVLDRSASMAYGRPNKFDWARLAATAIALLAIDQGDRVRLAAGLHSLDLWTGDLGGPAAAEACCQQLADLHTGAAEDLSALLADVGSRLERRSLLIVFSDLLAPTTVELARAFGALRARGHDLVAIQVLDRSELDLPRDWGPSRLHDPEERCDALVADPAALAESYGVRLQAHLADCRRLLAAVHGDLVLAATDRDVGQVLGDWLHQRERRTA